MKFKAKDWLALSLVGLYSLVLAATALLLNAEEFVRSDGVRYLANPVSVLRGNLLSQLSVGLGLPLVPSDAFGVLLVVLCAIYVVVFTAAVIYEMRLWVGAGRRTIGIKQCGIYAATFAFCAALSLGLGLLLPACYGRRMAAVQLVFLGQCLAVAALVFAVIAICAGLVVALCLSLRAVFAAGRSAPKSAYAHMAGDKPLRGEQVFPALFSIDREYAGDRSELPKAGVSLKQLCFGFRDYLAYRYSLFYDIQTVRLFVSAFSATNLVILEGVSGTGKSSLPRYFAEYVGGRAIFLPVSPTWRDGRSLLGHFNDFTHSYDMTDCLAGLYRAGYEGDRLHIFVLDDMNAARAEHYFSDFLSVMELPEGERKLRLMHLPADFNPPALMPDGNLAIPHNCLFVGTVNRDDGPTDIPCKVYDRSVAIPFQRANKPFAAPATCAISLGRTELFALFESARGGQEGALTAEERADLAQLLDYMAERLDMVMGNRAINQIEKLLPVYVACGGDKTELLDLILSRRIEILSRGRGGERFRRDIEQLYARLSELFDGKLVLCIRLAKRLAEGE